MNENEPVFPENSVETIRPLLVNRNQMFVNRRCYHRSHLQGLRPDPLYQLQPRHNRESTGVTHQCLVGEPRSTLNCIEVKCWPPKLNTVSVMPKVISKSTWA